MENEDTKVQMENPQKKAQGKKEEKTTTKKEIKTSHLPSNFSSGHACRKN